ncbi:MAG: hypothetical protein KJ580_05245 [Nanoarchaeota archaeon]|nr:hypothetical protein [Nanoarchaeota archaeon]
MEQKQHQELVDIVQVLTPEWNHLEIDLLDQTQDEAISDSSQQVYARVTDTYELARGMLGPEKTCLPVEQVKVFGGTYPLGKPWQPLAIQIYVDGHSHVLPEQQDLWPTLLSHIKQRVGELVSKGYIIREFSALKNQKDDFPGNIDAEESVRYFAVPSTE